MFAIAAFTASGAASTHQPLTDGMRGWPVRCGSRAVDASHDPWVAVDDAAVSHLLTPAQRRVRRARRIVVDYNADGIADVAWMVRNSMQMGVLVRLGASGRIVLAYCAHGEWGDQQLYRVGQRTIEIEFPESTAIVLSSASGRPMVYFSREGD